LKIKLPLLSYKVQENMARKHRCFTVTDSALCDTTATALEESRDRPKQGHVPADPRREGRELVLNLLERF